MRTILKKATVAVAGVIVGYLLASSQGEASVTTANVKDAVVVTSETELAEVTNAVVHESEEEDQDQPAFIPAKAKANTTRDKQMTIPEETETVSSVVMANKKAVATQKPETVNTTVVSMEAAATTATVEPVPVEEVQVTEPPVEETIPAPAPPPVPAAPVVIDNSQQAQVLDEYNAVADAAIADVLNSLDL